MVVPQRKFREIVFQIIYSQDLNAGNEEQIISSLLDQFKVTKKTLRHAHEKVGEVMNHVDSIDNLISMFSRDYDFKRISRVERNVLRLGVFELLCEKDLPYKVALAEAIRLSKKFGTPEGGSFVNAVLDAIYHSKEKETWISDLASKQESL